MTEYKKGNIVIGVVTGIETYGIFVNLDNCNNGLIHISEISDDFVRNPADFVNVGEQIRVLVIEDKEDNSSQVKLSIKNIDYRISKNKNKKIIETPNGFLTLKKHLPIWIQVKEAEIKEKVKKTKKS